MERTEKLDDYALAGIGGYWIVNPFDREVEIYKLCGGEYALHKTASTGVISVEDSPGVAIDLSQLWEGRLSEC